jgi:ketosteroid isomerase-like protein
MADNGTQAVMEGYLSALRSRGEFDRFLSPDVTWTTMETGEQVRGRSQVRDHIVAMHTQVFDAAPELIGLVVDEGEAMLEARFVGRHTGTFGDLEPTGRAVNVPYCVAYDIADGAITALRAYLPLGMLRAQLTGAPQPARASASA